MTTRQGLDPSGLDAGDAVAAARAGDGDAFRALLAPHLRALHLHCYRLLGSYVDAEEAVREATVRAWRGRTDDQGRWPLRHWLYRITTTVCLDMVGGQRRDSRVYPTEVPWLQPYPDLRLDELPVGDVDPAAVADRRDCVGLAFIAALQRLPATQRAVLILRDVLGWPAREVCDLLDTTVAGVHGTLRCARATPAGVPLRMASNAVVEADERRVLDGFVAAWRDGDLLAFADLLREDVVLTMPPQLIRIVGRTAVVEFFATVPAGGRLDRIRLVEIRANGHPGLAMYPPADDAVARCRYGIMVLIIAGDRVATITGFHGIELFPIFDLPAGTRPSA